MGRINVEIPDDVHKNIKKESADTGIPMKDLIIRALREKYGDEND